jgi:hypothetical protein
MHKHPVGASMSVFIGAVVEVRQIHQTSDLGCG